jgi:hypothetical protein
MLLTSRETHRWVIPKGWPIKKRKPAEVASQEAYEEAGLVGRIVGKRPVGRQFSLREAARQRGGSLWFFISGRKQSDEWPEKSQRETKWSDAEKAVNIVEGRPDDSMLMKLLSASTKAVSGRSSNVSPARKFDASPSVGRSAGLTS